MLYVLPFLVAMVVTIAWLPIFARYAVKWAVVDQPGARKVHSVPIPRVGGIAMGIGVLVAALMVIPLDSADRYLLAAAAVLMLFGALDDRYDLDYRLKLAGQLIAAAIIVFGADVQIHSISLDDRLLLPAWISVPLSLFFLVGITNAINLADGLDGLAGGTTFLSLCAIALLAHIGGQAHCAAFALAFAGAVLGFLRFNTYPATVFMGDAGSQLLGFAVGVLSLRATQSGESAVSAAVPVLLLAFPILDTLSVMVQRVSERRSPFSGDKNHIHHKLLALGFDHHEAVVVIYAIQADLFLLAYWMRYESDLLILATVSVFFLCALALMTGAARRGWRFRARSEQGRRSPIAQALTRLRRPALLPRWSYLTVAFAIGAYALLVMIETVSLSDDITVLLLALLAVTLVWLGILRIQPLSLIEKAALYVTAAVLVYIDAVVLAADRLFATLNWIAVLIAAGAAALRLYLIRERHFELTPLDLIVVFAALVIPSLSDAIGLPNGGTAGIAKLVILFYSIEILVSHTETRVVWLRVGVVTVLAGLIVRPFLLL